jgi:hypothetical protein
MIAVRRRSLLAITIALTVSVSAAASDELARARDLYRAAAYDEALVALDQIAGESSGPTLVELNEYRLFCLIALDRKTEARVAIESMVNGDPFYQLSADQASPRVRSMFKEIRQALLPGIVQREYATARASFDRQDTAAAAQFERVVRLLDDPLLTPSPALTDLRTVSTGFRDLAKARVPKVEAPPPVAASVIAAPTTPAVVTPVLTAAPEPLSTERASASVGRPGPPVYHDSDADVVPPVILQQAVPQWVVPQGTRTGAWQPEAVLEVTIDESGSVVSAMLRKPFHPTYDPVLIKAALAWKYEPARKGGMPVRFVKVIAIRLSN